MSKSTASAAGGAMPAEGHDPDPSRELLGIVNDIDEVRHVLDAIWMAVDGLEIGDKQAALHAVLDIAQRQLTAARDRLNAARSQKQEATNV